MYKLLPNSYILRTTDSAVIPPDKGNLDYVAYCVWVAAGNSPDAADAVSVSYPQLNARQIRRALTKAKLRDAFETYITNSTQDIQDWWKFSDTYSRQDATLLAIASALSITSATLDTIWTTGVSL
jgi:hypothetical protein